MRPGTKVRFFSPRFTNRPEVEPPGLLRLLGATSILSVVGFLVYAVAQNLTRTGTGAGGPEMAYVATLHFVLPLAAFYSITTNSRLSRIVITIYALTLGAATISGRGILGELPIDPAYRIAITAGALLITFAWLFGSPRIRYYYAALSDKPIPPDLASRESELQPKNWLSPKVRSAVVACLDYIETIVLLGFIVVVIYAFISTG